MFYYYLKKQKKQCIFTLTQLNYSFYSGMLRSMLECVMYVFPFHAIKYLFLAILHHFVLALHRPEGFTTDPAAHKE